MSDWGHNSSTTAGACTVLTIQSDINTTTTTQFCSTSHRQRHLCGCYKNNGEGYFDRECATKFDMIPDRAKGGSSSSSSGF
jgi:hypothetical protein